MKHIFVIAVIVLSLSAQLARSQDGAQGGFNAEETASILKVRDAYDSTMSVIEKYCDFAGNELDCKDMNLAAYSIGQAMGWLLHLNVAAAQADGEALLSGPRSEVLAAAWGRLDLALSKLGLADSFKVLPDHAAAVAAINAVDRSLAYATPWPVLPSSTLGTDPNNQFGPHGNYPGAQHSLWRVIRYNVTGALGAWFEGVRLGEVPACAGVSSNLANAGKRTMQTLLLSAHVIDDASFAAYRTDAEEALPAGGEARRALTEIHLVYGPGDSIGASNTTLAMRVATALSKAGQCQQTVRPNYGRFLVQFADGWNDLDKWAGDFNEIR